MQTDLFGQSLYNYVYPDDHEELTKALAMEEPTGQLMIADVPASDENSNSSSTSSTSKSDNGKIKERRRSFNIRMSQRTASRREHTQYECLHVSGLLRAAYACRNSDSGTGGRSRNSGKLKLHEFSHLEISLYTRSLTYVFQL